MKSKLPRPLVNAIKSIYIPYLRKKWSKDPIVKGWIQNGQITDSEIDWLVLNWQKHGSPKPPPPKIKQEMVTNTAKEYGCDFLVETGTYKGDMIFAQLDNFSKLYSIELSKEYWNDAKERFKNSPHVTLLLGDSGAELPKLTPTLNGKGLFWLDGHYCGGVTAKSDIECPIYNELDAIFNHNNGHVILIDDARDFVGKNDYPTIEELRSYVMKKAPEYSLEVRNDVIYILPNK